MVLVRVVRQGPRRTSTETSFLAGGSFSGPADFNTQLAEWLKRVNQRPRRALGCAPCDRLVAERQQMVTLPPVPPATGWRIWLRLPWYDYVRLDGQRLLGAPVGDRPFQSPTQWVSAARHRETFDQSGGRRGPDRREDTRRRPALAPALDLREPDSAGQP